MPAPYKIGVEFGVVVRFAVEDDPQRFVFIGDGLVATCHINNGEPPHRQADAGLNMEAVAIGSAMEDGFGHRFERATLGDSRV